jgi:hypothetical protein
MVLTGSSCAIRCSVHGLGGMADGAPPIRLELFADGSYRWAAVSPNGAELVQRGHYTFVGTTAIRFRQRPASSEAPGSDTTYTITVLADQLTLQNGVQTIVFTRA